jgi:hypothetical protein
MDVAWTLRNPTPSDGEGLVEVHGQTIQTCWLVTNISGSSTCEVTDSSNVKVANLASVATGTEVTIRVLTSISANTFGVKKVTT